MVYQNGRQIFYLDGREGKSTVAFKVSDSTQIGTIVTGDSKLGKGVLGAIPLHLVAEAENIKLSAGQKLRFP